MIRLAALVCTASLAAAAGAQACVQPHPGEALEPVREVIFGEAGVTLRVTSNGCTGKPSFVAHTRRSPSGEATLKLVRVKPDYCRALLRNGVALTWSYAELGLAPGDRVVVVNRPA